jgi:DNA-binding GntR family transcriptional regulator
VYTQSNTASATAYHQLKALILLGDVPVGIRLREERIAERLGMSRTPIREALLRLHVERFLDRHPEGGFRATNPSARTMRELYEIRSALELHAPEPVKRSETLSYDAFCASSSSVTGSLIHAMVGSLGGSGLRWRNRAGLRA